MTTEQEEATGESTINSRQRFLKYAMTIGVAGTAAAVAGTHAARSGLFELLKLTPSEMVAKYSGFLFDSCSKDPDNQKTCKDTFDYLTRPGNRMSYSEILLRPLREFEQAKHRPPEAFRRAAVVAATLFYDRWTPGQVKTLYEVDIPGGQNSNYLLWNQGQGGLFNRIPHIKAGQEYRLDPNKHISLCMILAVQGYKTLHTGGPIEIIPESLASNLGLLTGRGNNYEKSYAFAINMGYLYEAKSTLSRAGLGLLPGQISAGLIDPHINIDLASNEIGARYGALIMHALYTQRPPRTSVEQRLQDLDREYQQLASA